MGKLVKILGKIVTGLFCIYLMTCFFNSISYNNNAYILFFVFTSIITISLFTLWKKSEPHPLTKKDIPIVVGMILPSMAFFSWLIVNSIFVSLINFDLLAHETSKVEVDINGKSCSTIKGLVSCYVRINDEKYYLPTARLQNIQLGKTVVTIKKYPLGVKIE